MTPVLSLGCAEGGGIGRDIPARKTYEAFIEDDLVRSAVERQLEIIGEALSQLAKVDPQIAGGISELRRIIAFRNILAHGYAAIDYGALWQVIEEKLPELQRRPEIAARRCRYFAGPASHAERYRRGAARRGLPSLPAL